MADFREAFEFTMAHEDPSLSGAVTVDAGGRTRFGIAEKFHPGLDDEFFSGPASEAMAQAEDIEHAEYWAPLRLAEIADQDVANKLFDMAVNMGAHQAVVLAQRAANVCRLNHPDARQPALMLIEDGLVGEATLAAVNASDPLAYRQMLCEFSKALYQHIADVNPAQAVNLAGWLKRAEG